MIDNLVTCAFPDCARPVAPPPATGGRSRYCDDPRHNPATAYRARRRQSTGSSEPAAASAPDPADPAALRERFERDLARLEATLAEVRAVLAPGEPAEATLARVAELELAATEAATARAAAEADLERLRVEIKQADADQRSWLAETTAHVERVEAERDAALARVAELERATAERDAALARVAELEAERGPGAVARLRQLRADLEDALEAGRRERAEAAAQVERVEAERDAALGRVAGLERGLQVAEDRAYAAESAWRTLDWQLEQQLTRAETAEAELRTLRGEPAEQGDQRPGGPEG